MVTGNPGVVDNDVTRQVLRMGASYRQTTDSSVEAARQGCLISLMYFIQRILYEKIGVGAEYCKRVYSNCLKELDSLAEKALAVSELREEKPQQDMHQFKRSLTKVQDKFVITTVDKAQNNFAFVCKKQYVTRMNEEMGVALEADGVKFYGNQVYTPVPASSEEIVEIHEELTIRLAHQELSDDNKRIPLLWANVKFHKNPIKYRFIAGAKFSSMKPLAITLTKILVCIKRQWKYYLDICSERTGIRMNWSIDSTKNALHLLRTSKLPNNTKLTIADFSTLYTSFRHDDIIQNLHGVIERIIGEGKNFKYISIGTTAYLHNDEKRKCFKWRREDIFELLRAVVTNSYVTYGGRCFRQTCGIPMGSNSSTVIADLCLSYMEFKFLSDKRNIGPAKQLSFSTRYIDDIITFGSEAMKENHRAIYPDSLPLSFDDTNDGTGHYLDIFINRIDKSTSLFDKRKDFNFEVIRFPDKSSNQPIRIGLNILYSQMIRIANICSTSDEFHKHITEYCATVRDGHYSIQEIRQTIRRVIKAYPLLLKRHNIHIKTNLNEIIN